MQCLKTYDMETVKQYMERKNLDDANLAEILKHIIAEAGLSVGDLFDDEQSRFLSDPALLERLATEKLEALQAENAVTLNFDVSGLRVPSRLQKASTQPQ